MPCLFVTGAHTDVGKTFVACALITAARRRGASAAALKPLVSGFDPQDWGQSDPGRLLAALGLAHTQETLDAISPWRYRAPLAPPMAAALEGRAVDLAEVARSCGDWGAASQADLALIEGVGGVMSPLSRDGTCLDLIARLDLPCLLVGGGYLGAISHTLTAVEALRARRLAPLAVVVSQDGAQDAPDFGETVSTLARFLPGLPVIAAPRGESDWAGALLDLILRGA